MLEVPESAHRSDLFRLKAYPPEGKPATILSFLTNYHYLHLIGVDKIRLAGCSVAIVAPILKPLVVKMSGTCVGCQKRRDTP